MKSRILITGGSGLLAVNCALQWRDAHEVVLALHQRELALAGVSAVKADLTTPVAIAATLDQVRPHYVIHTAALTNVEQCEADPGLAQRVNVDLARQVAAACHAVGCRFVHISTDHLFDDSRVMADEQSPVSPLNEYGRSKAAAEAAVTESHPGSLVLRTNFYGWGPQWRRSFSDVILENLRAGKTSRLFTDVHYTPIVAEVLIDSMMELLQGGHSGIFNVVGDERLSKYDFGLRLANAFGLDQQLLMPVRFDDVAGLVKRPREMSLDNAKLRGALGKPMGDVDSHVALLRQARSQRFKDELDAFA